jgi:transcriptional regulator with XRE-family HTH domain
MKLEQIIGTQLMKRRNHLGWSQNELAERSGIAKITISKMERGIIIPKINTLLKLARALNTDINYFLEGLSLYSPKNANEDLLLSIFKNLKPSLQVQLIDYIKYLETQNVSNQ